MRTGRRHRSYGMPFIQHLVLGETIVAHKPRVDHRPFTEVSHLARGLGQLCCGHDGLDARKCHSAADVDALDVSVGVRAAQDLAVQEPREPHVSTILRPAGDLVRAVRADGPRANDGVSVRRTFCRLNDWGDLGCTHADSTSIRVTAYEPGLCLLLSRLRLCCRETLRYCITVRRCEKSASCCSPLPPAESRGEGWSPGPVAGTTDGLSPAVSTLTHRERSYLKWPQRKIATDPVLMCVG